MSELLIKLFSSGLIICIITSICSILVNFSNNKRIKKIVNIKHNFELDKYRYEKLHNYLNDLIMIQEEPKVVFSKEMSVSEASEALVNILQDAKNIYLQVSKIANLALPLLNQEFYNIILNKFKEVEEANEVIRQSINGENDINQGKLLISIVSLYDDFKKTIVMKIQEQLQQLIID